MRPIGRMGLLLALICLLAAACRRQTPTEHDATAPLAAAARAPRWTAADLADTRGDGFPDAAHLTSAADREAFRTWFAFLAESQYQRRHPLAEVTDCAALARFAFREALLRHTSEWRRQFGQYIPIDAPDVQAYNYPDGVLGTNLFRVRPGAFQPTQLHDGTFRQFADARMLLQANTRLVSRNTAAARPGDLLFFYQPGHDEPFHTMIFLGTSAYLHDGIQDYVVYDTGEDRGHDGIIKLVPLSVLARHPQPRWRPVEANPAFLGVFRWRILQ